VRPDRDFTPKHDLGALSRYIDTVISDDELLSLDEFALLGENAAQAGFTGPLPAVTRLDRGPISALRWGTDPPRVVFLHGGGQNAHTWDTVILGLGLPALAIDLPGHGRSAWREDGDYGPKLNAAAVEPVVRELAPDADLVVGMSLGGLTAMRLAVTAPELVPTLVMVDVTPSAPERHEQMTKAQMGSVALVEGERNFPSFAAMVDVTVARLRTGLGNRCGAGFFTIPRSSTTATGPGVTTPFAKATDSMRCGTMRPRSLRRQRWCVVQTHISSTTTTRISSPA